MMRFMRAVNFCARWAVPTLMLMLLRVPVFSQQVVVSAPLTADQVVSKLVQENESRAKLLEAYSSLRVYHLECHCVSHKVADMVVRANYEAPDKKTFTILSESGSGTVRNRAFKKLLEAEEESMRAENQQRSAIAPENYTFQIVEYKRTDKDEVYVLEAQPRTKNKFLFRGRIWVDARDFAITRVEGQPAVNPSWWTLNTEFKRSYGKVGNFWLPASNRSETEVRVFGKAVLTIEYSNYELTQVGGVTVASSLDKFSNGQ